MVSPPSVVAVTAPRLVVGVPADFVVCKVDVLLMVVVAFEADDVTVLLAGSVADAVALLVVPLLIPAALFTSPCVKV